MTDEIVGILGSGQLAQMLAQAAARAGIPLRVYAGPLSDESALRSFLAGISVCGFESEWVDCALLARAAKGLPVRFAPSLATMEKASEKLVQKEILRQLGIPSAPYLAGERDIDAWLERADARFGGSYVVKWSKHGYDGKGVFFVEDGLKDTTSREKARMAALEAAKRGVRFYAEERADFVRELAIIGCMSLTGDFAAYPLVISEQRHGICRRVLGPARAFGVDARFEALAREYAEKIAREFGIIGSFGVEFFESPRGQLWVNEIAPRVHNSGHYTQDAVLKSKDAVLRTKDASLHADQFDNHLRAILGKSLAGTECQPFFAMLNLLGPEGGVYATAPAERVAVPAGITRHLYDKRESRPGRKLGHLNCIAATKEELTSRLSLMENHEIQWTNALRENPSKSRK